MKSTSHTFLLLRVVFFYHVTIGWIFDISLLCENSINQTILIIKNIMEDFSLVNDDMICG